MKYPAFLKKGQTIGIFAPSAGVGRKLDAYKQAVENFRSYGFQVVESGCIEVDNVRSDTAQNRAQAYHALLKNESVDVIWCATGGQFQYEICPYIDEKLIQQYPKLCIGYSDPTSLLLQITTKCDIATAYGLNAVSLSKVTEDTNNNMQLLMQQTCSIDSYKQWIDVENNEHLVCVKNDISIKGRCIGGCLDVILHLMDSPYCDLKGFINKYQQDGIVWYFDIYDMNSEIVYLTLLQMKYAGLFEHCKGVLFGRVFLEKSYGEMSFSEAYEKALGDIPYAYDLDIGHTDPKTIMINGALCHYKSCNQKGTITFYLE